MKSTNIIITIIVLILIAGGSYALVNNQPEDVIVKDESMMKDDMMKKDEVMMKDEMIKKDEVMMKDEAMMKKDDNMMTDKTVMVKGGMYTAYSPEKLANAESGDVVLFFKASWCPSCRTVDADIKSNLTSVPKNLTILELDYDKTADLKKTYGVTSQHTFVQVDKDGKMIKKWSGGSTLNSIVKEII